MSDPTAYSLGGDETVRDPRLRRLDSYANFGGQQFRLTMPYMTQVTDNLWHGGVAHGLNLPDFIEYKLSLYQDQDYWVRDGQLKESLEVKMYDSVDQGFDQVQELAEWVNEKRKLGPVLSHCQAGLNRSSLIIAAALVTAGDVSNGQEAIDLMRLKRDPAVLCNPAFEAWVQAL